MHNAHSSLHVEVGIYSCVGWRRHKAINVLRRHDIHCMFSFLHCLLYSSLFSEWNGWMCNEGVRWRAFSHKLTLRRDLVCDIAFCSSSARVCYSEQTWEQMSLNFIINSVCSVIWTRKYIRSISNVPITWYQTSSIRPWDVIHTKLEQGFYLTFSKIYLRWANLENIEYWIKHNAICVSTQTYFNKN